MLLWNSLIGAIAVSCIGYHVLYEQVQAGSFGEYKDAYNTLDFIQNPNQTIKLSTTPNGEQAISDAGQWLVDNVESGSSLITDYSLYTDLFFYSNGQFPIHELKYPGVNWYLQHVSKFERNISEMNAYTNRTTFTPLFMWFRPNQNIDTSRRAMYMVSEEVWLSDVVEKSIEYVVVSPTFNVFSIYFTHNPSFSKVAEFDGGAISIYHVNSVEPSPIHLPPIVNVVSDLNNLKRKNPERYNYFINDFYRGYLGWNNSQISEFLSDYNEQFRLGQSFSGIDYYTMVSKLSNHELSTLIAQREKLLQQGSEVWNYAMLAGLHLIAGDEHRANDVLSRAPEANTRTNLNPYKYYAEAQIAYVNTIGRASLPEDSKRRYLLAFQMHPNLPEIHDELVDAIRQFKTDSEFLTQLHERVDAYFSAQITLGDMSVESYLDLADVYRASGQYDLAIKYYLDAITDFDQMALAYEQLAATYVEMSELGLAAKTYEKALSISPVEMSYYVRLGELYEDMGHTKEAYELYMEAQEKFPNESWPHLAMGKLRLSEAE